MSGYTAITMAVIGAVSAVSQARQQQAASKYNEKVANQQATVANQVAESNAERQKRSAAKKIGSMEAAYAASGVSQEGSVIDVLEESSRNAELDRLNILHGGKLQALGYQNTAALNKAQGKNAMSAGYMSAAGTLIGGSGAMFSGSAMSETQATNYMQEQPSRYTDYWGGDGPSWSE